MATDKYPYVPGHGVYFTRKKKESATVSSFRDAATICVGSFERKLKVIFEYWTLKVNSLYAEEGNILTLFTLRRCQKYAQRQVAMRTKVGIVGHVQANLL